MANRAIRTTLPDGRTALNNIIDKFTGESIQLVKMVSLPSGATADGIIYFETNDTAFGTEYWARADFLKERVVNVKWFGAKGDGTTDDTATIQAAADFCGLNRGNNVRLYVPQSIGAYATTGTISVPWGVNIDMQGGVSYVGDGVAMVVGDANNRNMDKDLRIDVTATNDRSDWENDSKIGVILYNNYHCNIDIKSANFFTSGVICRGDNNNGFAYNEVVINEIAHNKNGLVLTSSSGGWCNENNFYNGRFWNVTQANTAGKSRYGIVITSEDGYLQNNNVFYKPSIELRSSDAAPGEAVAILIERGRHNRVISMRDEGNTRTVKTLNDSWANDIDAGFTSAFGVYETQVEDLGVNPSTVFSGGQMRINTRRGGIVHDADDLMDDILNYSEDSFYSKSGTYYLQSSSSSNAPAFQTGYSKDGEWFVIGSGRGIGVRVDSSKRKRFTVSLVARSQEERGRLYVVCRDAGGNILSGDDPYYVRTSGRYGIVLSSQFGGGYGVNLGVANRDVSSIFQDIVVAEEVADVTFYIAYYQQSAYIKRFTIYSLDGDCGIIKHTVPSRLNAVDNGVPQHTAHRVGDLVMDTTSPSLLGWKCVSSGTPGDFIPIPVGMHMTPPTIAGDENLLIPAEVTYVILPDVSSTRFVAIGGASNIKRVVIRNENSTGNSWIWNAPPLLPDGSTLGATIPNGAVIEVQSNGTEWFVVNYFTGVVGVASTTVAGNVLMAAASADSATAVSATYDQAEVQAILDELRDLKTKMRAAGLLDT